GPTGLSPARVSRRPPGRRASPPVLARRDRLSPGPIAAVLDGRLGNRLVRNGRLAADTGGARANLPARLPPGAGDCRPAAGLLRQLRAVTRVWSGSAGAPGVEYR